MALAKFQVQFDCNHPIHLKRTNIKTKWKKKMRVYKHRWQQIDNNGGAALKKKEKENVGTLMLRRWWCSFSNYLASH